MLKILLPGLLLSGCVNGPMNSVDVNGKVEQIVFKKFYGVPVLASIEGSYFRLNDEWVITARHNKALFMFDEFVAHPDCDVALVKIDGDKGNEGTYANNEMDLYFTGYPIARGLVSSRGRYIADIINGSCQYSAATNYVQQGMSGGMVHDYEGRSVGVIVGYASGMVEWSNQSHNKPAIFISLNYIKDWIEEVTGERLYNN